MAYEHILVEREDGVGIVTLNRPETLNAMNRKLGAELLDAVKGSKPTTRSVASSSPAPATRRSRQVATSKSSWTTTGVTPARSKTG
jgi:Enoyl-CoA hydratase/carnithine racemase